MDLSQKLHQNADFSVSLVHRRSRLHPNHQRDQRLLGPDLGSIRTRGGHARMAPGLVTLPLGVPVTIAAEVAIGG
jgi:hypothetical protein